MVMFYYDVCVTCTYWHVYTVSLNLFEETIQSVESKLTKYIKKVYIIGWEELLP